MPPSVLRDWLARQPFVPFRIHVTDQSHYDVLRPWMCWPGAQATQVAIIRTPSAEFWDESVYVANRAITRIEPLDPASSEPVVPAS